jgi:hypothetical protein
VRRSDSFAQSDHFRSTACSDADIDGAVNAAIFGAFMNQDQICMWTEQISWRPAPASYRPPIPAAMSCSAR